MTATDATTQIRREAKLLGFGLCGITAAVEPTGVSRLAEWLRRGYSGEMQYIAKREAAYRHPSHVLEGVRSIVMLAMNYRTENPVEPQTGQGRISRYAWGIDYHDLIRSKLNSLAETLEAAIPNSRAHGVVDTAPLLEREFAQLAGLGWIGKNTLLLNKQVGSWFFLAGLLTTAELEYDRPHETDHCGTCTACLDACPTSAFPQAYVLDASRCISYLTIEHRSAIPTDLRDGIGNWLFGCDVCQEVCPWNHRAPLAEEPAFAPIATTNPIELASLFSLSDEAFRRRFRGTPLWRAKRRGLLRNAAIVLGNQRAANSQTALQLGLNDNESLVRGAAAWALGKLNSPSAQNVLLNRLATEEDSSVREEIALAISVCQEPI